MRTEQYLGDGVYAVFDGYAITLDLRGQDSTTRIVLEPETLKALSRFVDSVAGQPQCQEGAQKC